MPLLLRLARLGRPDLLNHFLVKWLPYLLLDVGEGHCVELYRVESYGVNYKLFPFLPRTFPSPLTLQDSQHNEFQFDKLFTE
jgi:hypothetical protein